MFNEIKTVHTTENGWVVNKDTDDLFVKEVIGEVEHGSHLFHVRNWLGENEPTTLKSDSERRVERSLADLNQRRDKELQGFYVKNIFMNEGLIKTFESAIGKAERRNAMVNWITASNDTVQFSVSEARAIADEASDKVEEIYFQYRGEKNKVIGV